MNGGVVLSRALTDATEPESQYLYWVMEDTGTTEKEITSSQTLNFRVCTRAGGGKISFKGRSPSGKN